MFKYGLFSTWGHAFDRKKKLVSTNRFTVHFILGPALDIEQQVNGRYLLTTHFVSVQTYLCSRCHQLVRKTNSLIQAWINIWREQRRRWKQAKELLRDEQRRQQRIGIVLTSFQFYTGEKSRNKFNHTWIMFKVIFLRKSKANQTFLFFISQSWSKEGKCPFDNKNTDQDSCN